MEGETYWSAILVGFGLEDIHSLGMTSSEEYWRSGFVACRD